MAISLKRIEDYLDEIAGKLQNGRVMLFLGAGSSAAAGAPLQKKLVDLVKEKYPKLDQTRNNLLDICQDFTETEGYNIKDLEEFITRQFRDLQPSEAHIALTAYNWPAIFTTNFDDLVETAYRNSERKTKIAML
jgi:NAD-dependent SIR2 family protein deacetylase